MLKSYFQIAFRSLYRNKLTSLINITGLGLAIGCCIPFYHIIQYETSFDHFHEKADRIYRVILEWSVYDDSGQVHYPAADALQADFPDFERITRIHGPVSGKISIEIEGTSELFQEDQILYTDQRFFKTFDFKCITPITSSVLQNPNEVLLTASLARKYFSDQEPIGKILHLNDSTQLQVVGLLEDPSTNTNTPFRMIISYATFDLENKEREGWLFSGDETVYVTLRPGDDPEKFRQRLEMFTKKHVAFYKEGMYFYRLQPLKEIHTSTGFGLDKNYHARSELLWLPGFLGILIIIIACINFVNHSTAHAMTLAKEASIRKVVGSSKAQLLLRFLLQTFIIVFMALLLGLLLGSFLLNSVNHLFTVVNYHLAINVSTIFFLVLLGLTILILSGLYPAVIIANFKTVHAFRSSHAAAGNDSFSYFRKGLVAFQIGASLVILVAAIVITEQINFWKDTDLKFRTNDIVTFPVPEMESSEKESLRSILESTTGIEKVSFSCFSPLLGAPGGASLTGTKTDLNVGINFVDANFQDVYGLKLIAGENVLDRKQPTLLINEKLALKLGFSNAEDALGSNIDITILLDEGLTGTVSGVFQDFINGNPMDAKIYPYVIISNPEKTNQANVALVNNASPDILQRINTKFKQTYPNEIFAPKLMTNNIEESYELERIIQKAVGFISGLSILISCIGIIGIINFMGVRRRKEFSVRKVVGANSGDIMKIFLNEFIRLTIISFLIGGPIALMLLQKWLQNYPNRITLSAGYFLAAFSGIIIVEVMIILLQVQRISNVNPAETLRSE